MFRARIKDVVVYGKNQDFTPQVLTSLEETGDVYFVRTLKAFFDLFHSKSIAVVIICESLTEDLSALWKAIQINLELGGIPIVFLGRDESLEAKLRAFRLGADDFVTGSTSTLEIKARLRALIRRRNSFAMH